MIKVHYFAYSVCIIIATDALKTEVFLCATAELIRVWVIYRLIGTVQFFMANFCLVNAV